MNANIRHGIHAAIVFAVLWLGSLLLPQVYHFANIGAVLLGVLAYMVVYLPFNSAASHFAIISKDFTITTTGFIGFMILDFIPGALALCLLSAIFSGFWVSSLLIPICISVICELLYMAGAFIQER